MDGQGNFGSVDNDPPAHMRYTEARLNPIAAEILADIEKNTVDFQPNFDDSKSEPIVLPSKVPNLLVNGASGIGVSLATNIPPHNLGEVTDALIALINNPDTSSDELSDIIKGPDFPTGGIIFGKQAIKQAYAEGRGRIVIRAKAHAEESRTGRLQIIVTELPFQVNKAALVARIAELVKARKIEGISDLRDESDRQGMRVVIELGRGGQARTVLNALYKHTAMQTAFAVNMLALVDREPKTIRLKMALEAYIDFRREVIRRRSEFDLEKAQERAHILEGLLKAISQLNAIIRAIRESASAEAARTRLQEAPFALSERQAQAVLDMQLRRLAALERQKLEDEYQELIQLINSLEDLLANPRKIDFLIVEEAEDVKKQLRRRAAYPDRRARGRGLQRRRPHPAPGTGDHADQPRLHQAPAAGDRTASSAAAAAASPAWPCARPTPSVACWSPTRTRACCSSRTAAASSSYARTRCRTRAAWRAARRSST